MYVTPSKAGPDGLLADSGNLNGFNHYSMIASCNSNCQAVIARVLFPVKQMGSVEHESPEFLVLDSMS